MTFVKGGCYPEEKQALSKVNTVVHSGDEHSVMRAEQSVNPSKLSETADNLMQEHLPSSSTDMSLSNMSKAKRDLLQKYLRGEITQRSDSAEAINRRAPFIESIPITGESNAPSVTPVPRTGKLPLSFAQESLWFINQLEPASRAYNISIATELTGALDLTVLRRSLCEIVRRHESLRTRFVAVDGAPVQLITDNFAMAMPLVDLSDLTDPLRKQEADRIIEHEAGTPFDLEELPLLRVSLLKLGQQQHILILNMHHIISDGWSMGVLFSEIARLYEAFSSGEDSPLPDLQIQYTDYALWQRSWLKGEELEKQLSYWRERLTGAPPSLELPLDRRRPAAQRFCGSREERSLSRNLSDRLRQLSQREGVTLYMTVLAAFQVLLSKYSGQEDILVGSPIANRDRTELEGLIGFLVNTLVLRTDLSGNPTFTQLLARVREAVLGAFEHRDLPFEKIVSELRPERTLTRSPIFQVMFVQQNALSWPVNSRGPTMKSLEIDTGATKFDLTLFLIENEGDLQLRFEYNTDLFDSQTIARMFDHFQTLLEGIVANPGRRLSALPLLKDSERKALLSRWNTEKTDNVRACSIHDLIEKQAERSPQATAVVFENQALTYAELNSRANQVAYLLRRSNVSADVCVGLLVDRSVEMLVGLLGILKAGGAYVPLNPNQPKARLVRQLEQAKAPILITQERYLSDVAQYPGRSFCLDRDRLLLESEEKSNPKWTTDPQDLAYVIFTSGSTGTPKGVAVTHQNLVNYTEFICDSLKLDIICDSLKLDSGKLNFATTTTIAADLGNTCIFPSLASGGCLHVLSYETTTDSARFAEYMTDHSIDVLKIVPSHLNSLLASEKGHSILPQKYLISGGEALSWELAIRIRELKPDCEVINHYGPTEATIGSLTFTLSQSNNHSWGSATVPIGRPMTNAEIFILNEYLDPVPVGVPGELYIGGAGIARGYLNNPEQTSERFIPNPFSQDDSTRLYRTGDRARYLCDGNVEFFGRIDQQVKVRGYRIELGEIEAVLSEHPSIRQSVVVAREDRPGEKRLVAYVVLSEEVETIISDLRRWVKQRLPDYMVPSAFVMLDEVPLTANGKLDQRALPAPDGKQFQENSFVAPRNTLELLLTKSWEKVLGVRPIGVKDNFFDLGGDSLLAVRLFALIEKVYNKKLPLATLFQAPTVEQLVGLLSEEKWSPTWSSLIAIQPGGSKPPLFCLHLALGHVLFYRDLAHRLGADQPVYAFQPQGLDGTQPCHTRIEEMASHYIKEMRALQPEGPYFLGGSSSAGLIAFEMAQQLHAQGQEVGLLALFDTYAPGFPKFSPEARSLRYQVYRFMQRVNLHRDNLFLLEPREKWRYARDKAVLVRGRLKGSIKGIESGVKKAADKLYQSNGHSVPGEDQPRINVTRALSEYVPQVYPGRVTLFRASKRPAGYADDRDSGWGQLAAGGVDIHEIPGYHGSIVMEPRVRILAEELQACLNRAITNRSS